MEELINLIIATIQSNVTLSQTINIGQLPPESGISLEIAPSGTITTFQNKQNISELSLLMLRKSDDQTICLNELHSIGDYLSKLTTYPETNDIQWVNTIVTTRPNYVDKEDNGAYIYSMVLTNTILIK